MGNSFLVVNPVRREYLDPWCFGDNPKTGGYMQGVHPVAFALLVGPAVLSSSTGLEGTWNGHKLVVATDAASANQEGFVTGTPDFPDRNLYRMVLDEFMDLSYSALAMVCERSTEIRDTLARRAKLEYESSGGRSFSLLRHLRKCVDEADCGALNRSLCECFDEDWRDIYDRLNGGNGEVEI